MKQITEDYVSEEVAKLLQMKGFDEPCDSYYEWFELGVTLYKGYMPEVDGHGYSKPVLVMSDTNELLVATYSKIYDKWNAVGPISCHRLVVTHWMAIPSLEGGEE